MSQDFDPESRTILLVKHGSHAYGLATPESDVDVKGICIEPLGFHLGFRDRFEQFIRESAKGHPTDLVVYSFKKFAKLAADSNPNIIEILFGDPSEVIKVDEFGEELISHRKMFLSKKARHTFSGYAFSQLKRIKSHRSWLLNPPKEPPSRKDFGLSEAARFSKTEMGAFDNLVERKMTDELSNEALALYSRERAWRNMQKQWAQYQEWRASRNPKRAALEEKFGLDTKHASHLIRLLRMSVEILRDGDVIVKRPDREELLAIKRGERSYDDIIDEANRLERLVEGLYESSNVLPNSSNVNAINDIVIDITQRYLSKHG